jgi:CBS-domain-containing membrane protein
MAKTVRDVMTKNPVALSADSSVTDAAKAMSDHHIGTVVVMEMDRPSGIVTDRDITLRDVLPGAVLSGVAFFILQELSALIISHYLKNAQATYGHFATVITILWWFYLQSIITLLGAQLNVVLKERYYPRSLVDAPQTEADHRLLRAKGAEPSRQSRVETQQQ